MQTYTHAPRGQEFVLKDGKRLADLHHLYKALSDMSDFEFGMFVNADKNDFATWVEHSLNDKFLAGSLRRATTRERMQRFLFMHMNK